MEHRFILAGLAGCDRNAIEAAAAHLANHFAFEHAPMSVAACMLEEFKERGAAGLVVTGIVDDEAADWLRANGGGVIHLRPHNITELHPVSYQFRTDRFVIDLGDSERFMSNLEDVVVDSITRMQRRISRST